MLAKPSAVCTVAYVNMGLLETPYSTKLHDQNCTSPVRRGGVTLGAKGHYPRADIVAWVTGDRLCPARSRDFREAHRALIRGKTPVSVKHAYMQIIGMMGLVMR
jgi:hypothetical protein